MSLDDPRAKKVAQVVGNKTSQKILNYLAENSKKSEQDIATELKIPLNTVGDIKQLLDTGLIDKTNNFFWSKKGKKISLYEVSNKSIIFSPKKTNLSSQIKSILPVSLLAGIGALAIRLYHPAISVSTNSQNELMRTISPTVASSAKDSFVSNSNLAGSSLISSSQNIISLGSPIWWFIGGVLISAIIFILANSLIKLDRAERR